METSSQMKCNRPIRRWSAWLWVSRIFRSDFAFRRFLKRWCGRRESNPHRLFEPCGFSYRLRLSPPGGTETLRPVCGLDYPFTISRIEPGLRCRPSSLYTFPAGLRQAWLGIATARRLPRIWAVLHRRFPGEHSSFLKSAASAIPPRPRGCRTAFL